MASFSHAHSFLVGRLPGTEEEDPPDNTGTLYELFDSTNETSDWTERSSADNQAIFNDAAPYDNWSDFNLFTNGAMTVNNSSAGASDSVTYASGGSNICMAGGPACLDSKVGLSTMSLYNYLSTNFESGQMVVYSNNDASSLATRASHHSVNLIGSGIFSVLYWFCAFAVMGVITILGLVYAIGMMVNTVKSSVKVLLSIPGSMLGMLRSIVQVIVTVLMMIVEVIGTVFCFNLMSQLLILLVTVLDGSWSSVGVNATAVGGWLADVGIGSVQFLGGTKEVLAVNLAFTCLVLTVFAVLLCKKAYAFQHAMNTIRWFVWSRCLDPRVICRVEEWEVRKERQPKRRPVGVLLSVLKA